VTEVLARVVAPHFVAGLRVVDGVVREAAPILRAALGRSLDAVRRSVAERGWSVELLPVPRTHERVAVVGWRGWPEELRWRVAHAVHALAAADARTEVVTGDARGVDSYARDAALEAGLVLVVCVAPWDAIGFPAGPRRNGTIAQVADRALVFDGGEAAARAGHGRGTADVIRQFRALGKPVEVRPIE